MTRNRLPQSRCITPYPPRSSIGITAAVSPAWQAQPNNQGVGPACAARMAHVKDKM
jgi:hypothetical protein